jgi:hypothetical protein
MIEQVIILYPGQETGFNGFKKLDLFGFCFKLVAHQALSQQGPIVIGHTVAAFHLFFKREFFSAADYQVGLQ